MLQAFGVCPDAETVYLSMLRHGDCRVDRIAERLGWTEQRARAMVGVLVALALVRRSWSDPRTVRPVALDLGLEILLARQRADLTQRQQQIEEARAAVETLIAERHHHGPVGITQQQVEELGDLDAVQELFERIAYEAQQELLSFVPDGAQSAEFLAASRPLHQRLLDRGVRMRTIYLTSARNHPPTTAHARWLIHNGAILRTAPVLPLQMLVVDHQYAVVPIEPGRRLLDPARCFEGAHIVRIAGSVAAAAALFERYWRDAVPWDNPTDRDEGLNEQERAILELMYAGCTDGQMARSLGVSTRTVGRMTAELMARLGARSRFQAGALAANRGWIDATRLEPAGYPPPRAHYAHAAAGTGGPSNIHDR